MILPVKTGDVKRMPEITVIFRNCLHFHLCMLNITQVFNFNLTNSATNITHLSEVNHQSAVPLVVCISLTHQTTTFTLRSTLLY